MLLVERVQHILASLEIFGVPRLQRRDLIPPFEGDGIFVLASQKSSVPHVAIDAFFWSLPVDGGRLASHPGSVVGQLV